MDSLLVAAALLGLTHAVEPDHVAGIAALASDASRRRAALVGGCFATGHVVLVLGWVLLGSVVLSRLPATAAFDRFGGLVLGVVLLAVAALTAVAGARRLRGHGSHTHVHARLGLTATDGGRRGVREYLGLGVAGALFTLSPPLSMLALVTALLPTATLGGVLLAVLAYAVGILLAMTVVGAVAGTLFGALEGYGTRLHAGAQFLAAGVLAVIGAGALMGGV
ncbi:hypothetical protein N0B31_05345 [Salinirubellus salinus]|uniref:Nickel/cobalt efflux system n=1 Tax=Salinirubellus salinus TaxID=1364945 RepID=A0A9E7U5S0_9EURY|nr:hypothetical protein [Salinirubellus salinus]UWM55710.1 hypothetical protein N0B31_05345 [Salinirubellus salinus]